MAKDLHRIVKEILGTCVSVGCTVEGKDPKDLQQEIANERCQDSFGLIWSNFRFMCVKFCGFYHIAPIRNEMNWHFDCDIRFRYQG
ncbi:hypothetical protein OSB04_020129 [Centaurea solstitialis]|uniref:60S ribosomal protein L12 n=1 Tax=Centaurea solstitialis TaxID=347529 RepID=A0AA38T329_9ASTR|nr:hypothetical protein OSB04_020129 [Centaurea solstitialis]